MSLVGVRPQLIRLSCLAALVVSVIYLSWRALETFNPDALWLSLLLYGAECYGLAMFVMHVVLTWDPGTLERRLGLRPGQPLADARLGAPAAGTVDVFIPTYDESVALLRKTVLAARELRLPHETWVLDDGRRDEVRELAEELGVRYLTRASNQHAKAGNINAALARSHGDFVVVLDADFIARPGLLERTLPHFDDDGLAFVQLPQAFYNVDSIQHVGDDLITGWHEQSLFYDVIQPGKNRWNSAFWCGSPAVLRRAALESVGGAATSTITEDILTSMRMHAAGWRSLYHNEILAVGVAPGDLDGFRTQRLRWAQGSMQILRSRENPLWKPGLTLAQRVSYFASMATYFQAAQLAVFVSMPSLILLTGESPIRNLGVAYFVMFFAYMAATMLATKLTGGASQRMIWDQYFAFLRMFTFLRALGTLVTGGRRLRFRVTSKLPSESAQRRGLYPHVVASALNLGAIAALLVTPLRHGLNTGTSIAVCACAAIVVSTYAVALMRLWSRTYRRHDYRVPVALPACVGLEDGDERYATTEDISFGGASLLATGPLAPGTPVTLALLDELPITVDGAVVTCGPAAGGGHRIGIRFERLDLDDETRLLVKIIDAATAAQGDRRRHAAAAAPARSLALAGA